MSDHRGSVLLEYCGELEYKGQLECLVCYTSAPADKQFG